MESGIEVQLLLTLHVDTCDGPSLGVNNEIRPLLQQTMAEEFQLKDNSKADHHLQGHNPWIDSTKSVSLEQQVPDILFIRWVS